MPHSGKLLRTGLYSSEEAWIQLLLQAFARSACILLLFQPLLAAALAPKALQVLLDKRQMEVSKIAA